MLRFNKKTILVTGGTQGMGFITALKFAKEGASVCISGRNFQKGNEALKIIKEHTDQAIYIPCDVSNNVDVENMIAKCVSTFGSIDIAFNNAGVTSQYESLANYNDNHWDSVIKINTCGTYYCMKYEIQAMLKKNGGVIINNASCVGIMPIAKQSAYVASKHAVVGLTKSVALDYAESSAAHPQIRINAVAPGPILGGMNNIEEYESNSDKVIRKRRFSAMNRFGLQDEVAATVLWLASNEASYITGAIIPIDGGMSAGKQH